MRHYGEVGGPVLLSVSRVSKRFGERSALRDACFTVHEGEILGVIGPNGSGKTTLLECVAGLRAADAGEVRFRGEAFPPARRKEALFFMPDGIRPWADLPTGRILSCFEDISGSVGASSFFVRELGLLPLLSQNWGSLSKGELKRFLVATGLLAARPVLLFDEPFDGLDLRKTRDVMALLRRQTDSGRSLVVSLHQLADAERFCDRMVLLSEGRTVAEGSLPDLLGSAGLVAGGLEDLFLALA